MYTYRKVLAILILTATLFCLFSCAPAKKADALDILRLPAEFKIEGERNGVELQAVLSLGEMREDGTRSGEIVFSLPDAFRGLQVRTDSGIWEADLDGITVSGISAEALGAPLAPFTESVSAIGAELKKSENGEARTLITVPSDGGSLEFLIDSKSGLPVFLTEKNTAGEMIMEYRITDYKIRKTNQTGGK